MKVQKLIELLSEMDPNAEVHFSHGAGDYWRTTVAPTVSKVEGGRVAESDYHGKDVVIDEDDPHFDAAEEVVLLS